MKIKFAATFKLKSQQEWIDVFNGKVYDPHALFCNCYIVKKYDCLFQGLDACVEPVLTPEEAKEHPHNVDRSIFITTSPEMFEPGIASPFVEYRRVYGSY